MMEDNTNLKAINDLQNAVKLTENTACALYQNNMELAQQNINTVIVLINQYYSHFLENGTKYLKSEEEFPNETLYAQLEDLNDAVQNMDIMKLADTFYYEIREGLMFFSELLERQQ